MKSAGINRAGSVTPGVSPAAEALALYKECASLPAGTGEATLKACEPDKRTWANYQAGAGMGVAKLLVDKAPVPADRVTGAADTICRLCADVKYDTAGHFLNKIVDSCCG